jgi:hypothetical protein
MSRQAQAHVYQRATNSNAMQNREEIFCSKTVPKTEMLNGRLSTADPIGCRVTIRALSPIAAVWKWFSCPTWTKILNLDVCVGQLFTNVANRPVYTGFLWSDMLSILLHPSRRRPQKRNRCVIWPSCISTGNLSSRSQARVSRHWDVIESFGLGSKVSERVEYCRAQGFVDSHLSKHIVSSAIRYEPRWSQ